jgi:gliding motility-associated-like protein
MKITSTFLKHLLFLLLIISTIQLNAQCSTNIASVRDTVSCGDSLELQQIGVGGASSDDFTAGSLSGLWQSVTSGYVIGGPCGTNPNGAQHLWMGSGASLPRTATTIPVDASCGGDICFDFRQETQSSAPCDGPDQSNEGVYLQYKITAGVWTTIFYFSPSGFPYTGWTNFCYPIPPAAQTTTTQFRWTQTSASSSAYDCWGIDNVNIATCTGYNPLWTGSGIPSNYTQDSIFVSPYTTTTYNLTYSNWIDDTCYASKTIIVEQPVIDTSLINMPCAMDDTLKATTTIKRYCSYTLELWNYSPGGVSQQGWGTGGAAPNNFHNLDVDINNNLYSNYTMASGANATSAIYSIPVADGDQLDFDFTSLGNASGECAYKVYNSLMVTMTQQGFPGSTPGNYNTIASCPATAVYNYSWTNLTNPATTGINSPNNSTTTVSFSTPTQVQIHSFDINNPQCNVTDTIAVSPTSSITIGIDGIDTICEGDIVTLDFTLTGIAPFTLELDTGGIANAFYTLDNTGMVNGIPISFSPSSSTTYTIINITDSSGCSGLITIPNLVVVVNNLPNAGEKNNKAICMNSTNAYNLNSLLTGEDTGGDWTYAGLPITSIIDPSTYSANTHQFMYEVAGSSPCPNDTTVAELTLYEQPVISSFIASPTTVPQGQTTTLTITMSAGTPNFIIDIIDNGIYASPLTVFSSMQGTDNPTPTLAATTYSINLITDANGCTASSILTTDVTVEPIPIVNSFITATPEVCEGTVPNFEMTLISGVIPVTVYYNYNGSIFSEIFSNVGVVNFNLDTSILNLGINTITIDSIVDNSGTHTTVNLIPDPINVTINENPEANLSTNTPEICYGEDAILVFELLKGESPFNIDYTGNLIPQVSLTGISAGVNNHTLNPDPAVGTNTYAITLVTDNNGCTVVPSDSAIVNINPTPILGININGANPICFGENSSINFPVTNGTAPYILNYSSGNTATTINIDANGNLTTTGAALIVNPTTTTTYLLNTVTDNKGCTNSFTDNVLIEVKELPLVTISSAAEICEQDVSTLSFNFSAGTAPWIVNYTTNGFASAVSMNNANDGISISPITNTTYIIDSVSDAFCTTIMVDSTSIIINPKAEITVSGGGTACDDGSTVDVIFTINSGTSPFNIDYAVGINPYSITTNTNTYTLAANQTGTYIVTNLTDSKGCNSKTINGSANITIIPINASNITAFPEKTNIDDPLINFTNTAATSVPGIWDFGDGNVISSLINNIVHNYTDTGTFIVSFTAGTGSQCSEVAYQTIIIDPVFTIFIPNAFTPNSNQSNDAFLPIMTSVSAYDFSIYNRFGERVFNTQEINQAWNGKVNNTGEPVKGGVYVYALVVTDSNGKLRTYEGSVTLIR